MTSVAGELDRLEKIISSSSSWFGNINDSKDVAIVNGKVYAIWGKLFTCELDRGTTPEEIDREWKLLKKWRKGVALTPVKSTQFNAEVAELDKAVRARISVVDGVAKKFLEDKRYREHLVSRSKKNEAPNPEKAAELIEMADDLVCKAAEYLASEIAECKTDDEKRRVYSAKYDEIAQLVSNIEALKEVLTGSENRMDKWTLRAEHDRLKAEQAPAAVVAKMTSTFCETAWNRVKNINANDIRNAAIVGTAMVASYGLGLASTYILTGAVSDIAAKGVPLLIEKGLSGYGVEFVTHCAAYATIGGPLAYLHKKAASYIPELPVPEAVANALPGGKLTVAVAKSLGMMALSTWTGIGEGIFTMGSAQLPLTKAVNRIATRENLGWTASIVSTIGANIFASVVGAAVSVVGSRPKAQPDAIKLDNTPEA